MNTTLKENIRHCFSFLFDGALFQFIDINNDFNGSIVVAQSKQLMLRFIHDRADFSLDIAGIMTPDNWKDFYAILDILRSQGKVTIGYKHSNKMNHVKNLLKQYLPEIEGFFRKE